MVIETVPRVGEAAASTPVAEESGPELSIVMPCLNEADTLETCIEKAQRSLREHNITGEIIVADNGSTDGSQAIGARLGARVVHVEAKGYGSALMGGIAAARGKFIVMGDADDSYDFQRSPSLSRSCAREPIWYRAVACLRAGAR